MAWKKPTIVFLQGAFQSADFYASFEDALRLLGYPVIHPILPTCCDGDSADFPNRGVPDDVTVVRRSINELLDNSKTVIVIMHSYGGIVGSEAITLDMALDERKRRGLVGGIAHMLFIASIAVPEGFGAQKSDEVGVDGNSDIQPDGRYYFRYPENLMHELSKEEQLKWTARLIPHTVKVLEYVTTNAGWRYVPSTSFVADYDRAIPAHLQELTAKGAGAVIEHLLTGHMLMLSHIDLVVKSIDRVVKATGMA